MRLSRAIGAVAVVIVAGQILNVAQEMLIAAKFGTSSATDAYKMALVFPTMLALELASIVGAVVIPVFHQERPSMDESEIFSVGLNFFAAVALVVSTTIFFLAPYLLDLIAGGFSPETRSQAVSLLRILSLGVFFTIISHFLSNILNAHRIFVLPAFQRTFLYAGTLAGLVALGHVCGIQAAAIGFVAGVGIFVLLQAFMTLRIVRYSFSFSTTHPVVSGMVALAGPLILYSLLNQVNVLVEKRIVSGFEAGSLSALDFAFKLSSFFINFLVVGINTVLFPTLSQSVVSEDRQRLDMMFDSLVKGLSAAVIPASAVFILLGRPIVHLVFERGSFDARSTLLTSSALGVYSVGLAGQAYVSSLPRFYQALKNNSALLRIGGVAILFNVVGMLTLSHYFGFIGVAAATSLTALFYALLLFRNLRPHLMIDGKAILVHFLKVTLATLVFSVVVAFSHWWISNSNTLEGHAGELLNLAGALLLGGASYLALGLLLGVSPIDQLVIGALRRIRERPHR